MHVGELEPHECDAVLLPPLEDVLHVGHRSTLLRLRTPDLDPSTAGRLGGWVIP
jgi:hypothetical protein